MSTATLLPGSTAWLNFYRMTVPGTPQELLREHLESTGLSAGDAGRAVVMWNILMRGIRWQHPYRTAVAILGGGLKHHKIPEVPIWRNEWLDPLKSAPVWKARSWLTPDACDWEAVAGRPRDLASYDVNGMFLSAAGAELGTGAPEFTRSEDNRVTKVPGWLLVEAMDPIPAWLGGRWRDEPTWVPTSLVELLIEVGVLPLWSAGLVWPKNRRWLAPHVGLFREARKSLIACNGDPAARALLAVLKDVYTRAFGGVLRPRKVNDNEQDVAVNHGWGRMIPAVAQARMLRTVVKVRPQRLLGIYADAAWFLAPKARDAPLELSTQLGKFKPAGRLPWTDDLAGLYGHGQKQAIARRLKGEDSDEVDDDDELDAE